MKKTSMVYCFLAVLSVLSVSAQNQKNNFALSFNYGSKGLIPELNENWPIRQDVGYYYNNGFNTSVDILARLNYFGISPEFFFLNKKLSVSTGLRLTSLYSDIVKTDYDKGGYFFLRVKSEGLNTDYARVKAIREKTNYLGVPLEIKYIPLKFNVISFYVKLSAELAYKINSSTDIEFKLSEMESYQNSVLTDLNIEVNPLYASIYSSVGATIKLNKNLFCSLDVFFPSFYMTENNSSLVNMTNISGAQISVTVPF
ncbi:MAG: hypothetical protein Q7J05_00520 [Paludibacter sp.]|nr:hypothetical protein [Paludibacter sp.]